MEVKICISCGLEKEIDFFRLRKDTLKHSNRCDSCLQEYQKKYRKNNYEKLKNSKKEYCKINSNKKREYDRNRKNSLTIERKEIEKERQKKYYIKNRKKIIKKVVEYAKENPEKVRENKRKSRVKNREKRNFKERERKKADYLYKLNHDIKNLILSSFKKNNHKKKSKTVDILGCSVEFFKIYIESKFELWMNWENHGILIKDKRTWQIDHIIPSSSAKTIEELIKLNHYLNLRPLCSLENLKKSCKI